MRKLTAGILVTALVAMPVSADYVKAPHGLRVRERPTTDSRTIRILPYGAEVAEADDEPIKGWMRIEDGYVSREWISEESPKDGMAYLGNWRITAYAATGNPCANGRYPTIDYTIACNSLPFGTQVYIDGVGIRTVEDTDGGAMGNEWIDLYLGDYTSCVNWGLQYRDVYLVEDEK